MFGCEMKEERERLINKEERRISALFRGLDDKKKKVAEGLIKRAAFMRISLQDLEEDLNIYGFTEKFSQGDQEPYDRKRPTAELYNQLNANYQKIIKQLTDMLPKDAPKVVSDGFEDFINGRDD